MSSTALTGANAVRFTVSYGSRSVMKELNAVLMCDGRGGLPIPPLVALIGQYVISGSCMLQSIAGDGVCISFLLSCSANCC